MIKNTERTQPLAFNAEMTIFITQISNLNVYRLVTNLWPLLTTTLTLIIHSRSGCMNKFSKSEIRSIFIVWNIIFEIHFLKTLFSTFCETSAPTGDIAREEFDPMNSTGICTSAETCMKTVFVKGYQEKSSKILISFIFLLFFLFCRKPRPCLIYKLLLSYIQRRYLTIGHFHESLIMIRIMIEHIAAFVTKNANLDVLASVLMTV